MCSDTRSTAWTASHVSSRTSPDPSVARRRGLSIGTRRPPNGTVAASDPCRVAARPGS